MNDEEKTSRYLEIDEVRKYFGSGESKTEVLQGVTANIEKGSICVLLGPYGSLSLTGCCRNGSGRSRLLRR